LQKKPPQNKEFMIGFKRLTTKLDIIWIKSKNSSAKTVVC
jgi:hypothetical protein